MADFDTVIRGGTVVDGTRRPCRVADLAIKDGLVVECGRIPAHAGRETIDASGLIVAPGAIDLHTHFDAQVHWDPYCTMAGWHGVTSVTVGNCGFGLAPVRPQDAERAMLTLSRNEAIPLESMQAALRFDWETFGEWMDHLDRLPLGINLSHLAPVSPIAAYALGGFDTAKSASIGDTERARMVQLLHEALETGAVGWGAQRSTPGSFSSFQRDHDGTPMISDLLPDAVYLDFAAALRGSDGTFIQFSQNTIGPDDFMGALIADLAFNELLARTAARPVLYNGVAPVSGGEAVLREQVQRIASANADGTALFAQGATVRAPMVFTFEDWNLFDASPVWRAATLGDLQERRVALASPEVRAALRREYDTGAVSLAFFGALEQYVLHHTTQARYAAHVERSLKDIAATEGTHLIDALLDISLSEDLRTEWRTPLVNGDAALTRELLDSPFAIPGTSDGGAHVKFLTAGHYATDLLSWLVRDTRSLSLEEAHYRLSGLPAKIAGFRDRGTLEPGRAADIVVYDLGRLATGPLEVAHDLPAGQWRRVRRAGGYHRILVNGVATFADGRCTGRTPGRLLRAGRARARPA